MAIKFNCKDCDAEIVSTSLDVGDKAYCKSFGQVSTIPENEIKDMRIFLKMR